MSDFDVPTVSSKRAALVRLLWPYVGLWLLVGGALAGYTWYEIQASRDRGAIDRPVAGTDLEAFVALSEERRLETHRRYARHLAAFALLTLAALSLPIALVARRALSEEPERRRFDQAFTAEREPARTDPLTGVANRREYEDVMGICLAELARVGQPFVLAVIEVDRFRQFNDSRGHAAADRALQRIAQTLASCIRRTDLVARLGGNDFAVLMPATDAPAMQRPFSAMFSALSVMAAGEGWPISFNVGVIAFETLPERNTSASELADTLMYDVKEKGHSGVRFAAYRDGSLREVAGLHGGEDLRVP
jgi:diguanylate cyclase (GGDEF)-like protein